VCELQWVVRERLTERRLQVEAVAGAVASTLHGALSDVGKAADSCQVLDVAWLEHRVLGGVRNPREGGCTLGEFIQTDDAAWLKPHVLGGIRNAPREAGCTLEKVITDVVAKQRVLGGIWTPSPLWVRLYRLMWLGSSTMY